MKLLFWPGKKVKGLSFIGPVLRKKGIDMIPV
jgi:hypothetical protein